MWRPGARLFAPAQVGIRSGGQSSSAAAHPHHNVQSDSEDDDGFAHIHAKHAYENFDEVAPHEIDPLRDVPASFLLHMFEGLWRITKANEHRGDNKGDLLAHVHRHCLPSLLKHIPPRIHHTVAPETVYIAWLYFVSDSGRLNSTDRMQYADWALKEPLLPTPGWETSEYSSEVEVETWADCVQLLEWYRWTKLPQIIERNKAFGVHSRQAAAGHDTQYQLDRQAAYVRFRLEDPLDPISALLLIGTFESALAATKPGTTYIGIKNILVSTFARLVADFRPSLPPHFSPRRSRDHDRLDDHPEHPHTDDGRFLSLHFQPSGDELYRGFALYTRGLATRQAFQGIDDVSKVKVDAVWIARCRKAVGLGPKTTLLKEIAADDKVLERLSWKAWKDKVLGGKREKREEEDFELL
ncbi:hypothetical protein JCM10296v2_004877 [Rhodotorula toruloides]